MLEPKLMQYEEAYVKKLFEDLFKFKCLVSPFPLIFVFVQKVLLSLGLRRTRRGRLLCQISTECPLSRPGTTYETRFPRG